MLRGIRVLMGVAVLSLLVAEGPLPAWGAELEGTAVTMPAPPLVPASTLSPPAGTRPLAAVAAVAGTVVYAPFKLALLCPVMAVASGVTHLLPAHRGTSESLLRVGCGGTYVITPEMIRAQQDFQGAGGPLVQPERVRPQQRAEVNPAAPATP